jgi:glycerol-3-phosphate dehydrogenase (NAD(P)+)
VNISILGAGAWGSALAVSLSTHLTVTLWTRKRDDCEALARSRVSRYLPDVALPASVRVESDLARAIDGAGLAIIATATSGLREVARLLQASGAPPLAWACKGFETATSQLPHQIVAEAMPHARQVGALSGPSFALEVARGLPTALVFASRDAQFAASTAAMLNTPRLRIYSSTDVAGVELGGALKNVIAIAAGILEGLGLGYNTRAAVITRGLAEITRLGVALGAEPMTFAGLAGMGDLILTATGALSRNRSLGVALGQGQTFAQAQAGKATVAEGVNTARTAVALGERHGVELPIAREVADVLFRGKAPRQAVTDLMERDLKAEQWR